MTDEEKAAAALAAAAAAESTDPRLAALFARDESRSIVESNGVLWVDVPADVQKRMIAADDDAERQTIFESMTPAQQGAEKPAMPRGGNRASEDFDRETFIESLK